MGFEQEEVRIISDPREIKKMYVSLLRSAFSDISLIFSTPNAVLRQHRIGVTEAVKEVAQKRDVQVNLAIPRFDYENKSELIHSAEETIREIEELPTTSPSIHIREYIPAFNLTSAIRSTILLIDRRSSLIMDLVDDTKERFTDAIGFATYSENKSRTQSYGFVFDTIWTQAELYRQLELKTRELERLNVIQKDFVNVAAHELRTPTQAILGYSEMIRSSSEDKRNLKYEDAIYRNAERLNKLAQDILEVARIESDTLVLNKLTFDLSAEVENIITEFIEKSNMLGNKIVTELKGYVTVFGDREKISQVIINLIDHALKFTKNGTVKIKVEKNIDAIFTIEDTGSGIDKNILPRIFTKFASKSKSGTGLGLFISKAIGYMVVGYKLIIPIRGQRSDLFCPLQTCKLIVNNISDYFKVIIELIILLIIGNCW